MATTYNKAQLETSPLFRARSQLGDTGRLVDKDGAPVWLLDDDEITGFVNLFGYAEGIAQVADSLVTRFAQEPDEYEDEAGVRVRWSQRVAAWRMLSVTLRSGVVRTLATATGAPVGGQTAGPCMYGVRF